MDVRLPDGTIVRNVPDDITQEDLMDRVTAYRSEGVPVGRAAAQYAEETLGNIPQDILNIAQGAYNVAADPRATAQALLQAGAHPLETASTIGSQALKGAGQFIQHPLETFKQAPVSTALGLTAARGLAPATPLGAAASLAPSVATPIVRNLLNPKARMYAEAFGAQTPEAINALAAARPGLTSTQALADINAPAIQAIGEKAIQQVPQEARAVQQAQEASRAARIGEIAGTPEQLALRQAAREAEATANYGAAFKQAAPEIPEEFLARPAMKAAYKAADDIAAEYGGSATPMEKMHYVKLALDKIVSSPADFGLGGAQKAAIQNTRKEFIDQLEKVPEYAKARAAYAEQSVPINKMQIAQELQKALVAPLTGETTRAAMFARAAEEAPKTIKRATGQEFYSKLEDILSPKELAVVNDVRDEFRRTQLAKDQARLAKASGEDLASSQVGPISHLNLLNRVWTITNTIIKRSLGKIDQKLATEIGLEMLDPSQMKKALQAAQEYDARTKQIQAKLGARRPTPKPTPVSGAVTFQNVMAPQQNQNAMAR